MLLRNEHVVIRLLPRTASACEWHVCIEQRQQASRGKAIEYSWLVKIEFAPHHPLRSSSADRRLGQTMTLLLLESAVLVFLFFFKHQL